MAKHAEQESAILKEQRKLKEERAARAPKPYLAPRAPSRTVEADEADGAAPAAKMKKRRRAAEE